jgi:hypothetical protein
MRCTRKMRLRLPLVILLVRKLNGSSTAASVDTSCGAGGGGDKEASCRN